MKRQQLRLPVLLLLLGLGSSGIVASRSAVALPQGPPQAEMDIAEKHKHHRQLWRFRTGKNLPELARTATEDEIEITTFTIAGPPFGLPGVIYKEYPHPHLFTSAAQADAVVVGAMKSQSSHLTESEEFIFTDLELTVEEVIKDNPDAPIQTYSDITITRPGGTLQLHGRTVRVITRNFEPFQTGGRYVLFLTFIAETGSYMAFGDRSFQLIEEEGSKGVRKLTPATLEFTLESANDPYAFLTEVRIAVALTL